jgi:predicted nucleotidyltransferase component of viral defense system
MIDQEEIEAQAERLDVHVANVERDYVFGWLLKAFYENDYLARLLVFKGGNCMRKAFYPNTRFSSDLDFSVSTGIDPERFQAEINRACLTAQAACGVKFATDRNTFIAATALDRLRQSYKGKVYFWDFHDQPDEILISVRLDMTDFDRLFLAVAPRPLIHSYSDADLCRAELQCMALEELLANKLKCLIQRRHSYDLFDLVYAAFFERSITVDRGLVLRTFLQKTIFERSPGAAKEILLGLPTAFFRAAWAKYVAPKISRIDFEHAMEAFNATIEGIFGDVVSGGRGVQPFYPANYRNLILEAGSGRKLMRIGYHGQTREIEPYSLAYKRRQDGHAAEYFYAWDRTGGNSKVGIKTFLHQDIQGLDLIEETFDPRFEIELSKAGEAHVRGYFGKPFSRRGVISSARQRRSAGRGSGVVYVVECPYCQKRFRRSRPIVALKPHHDSNGYACAGRAGYLL